MKRNWFDIKVLILGFSKSGIAAAKYLAQKGANCFITEQKAQKEKDDILLKELEKLSIQVEFQKHSEEFINGAQIAITSPGIPPHSELINDIKSRNIQIISETELAYKETNTPFIAITGTNGKTTTTALTSHILSTRYKAPVCGNIGIPPTSLLRDSADYYVCELSSYQIEYSQAFKAQIAMFLNFTPDHIDWHNGLDNYFKAKTKIFSAPLTPTFAIFNATDEKVYEFSKTTYSENFYFGQEFEKNCCYIKNEAIYFKRKGDEEKIIDITDIPLVGNHNYQNVMASIIAAKLVGLENNDIKNAIKSFNAVEHRCEFTKKVNGIEFYNDSKATNPEAAIVAINSFEGKKVTLIAGGRDKMTNLDEFCLSVNKCISDVILIGEAAERFEQALTSTNFTKIYKCNTLEAAIDKSIELGNEICLFSPACASFDMFDNYEVRGEVFKNYVATKL